jgi:mannose-1-phosphate guanylyltransferase/phosphomannomutase
MKRALIAGLNSAGVTCHDLELAPMPLARFTVRTEQAAGGISVATSPTNPEIVEIRLFDPDGVDLGPPEQRKIERIYFRDDYRRASPSKLGELEFPPRALERYASGLLRAVDAEVVRRAHLKVVVDYAFGPASLIGPSILGRLGCDVLAVNAYVDEHRPSLDADALKRLIAGLADHVQNSGSDMGVLLEPGGEVAHLIDGLGRPVAHPQALLAFIDHETRRGAGTIAVPVSSPVACEELAAANGATTQWSGTALPALMARAQRPGVGFAGNAEGALIWPAFMPAPDGLMTFCKALELCAASGRLSDVVDALPEVHIARRDVRTPWAQKGTVMRHVAGHARPGKVLLLDGVKIVEEDRWALVIPYADEPLTRVWAEAPTTAEAEALADRYARLVEDAVDLDVSEST